MTPHHSASTSIGMALCQRDSRTFSFHTGGEWNLSCTPSH